MALAAAAAYTLREISASYRAWQQPPFVDIQPGTSSRQIAAKLHQAGVLKKKWSFLLLHYTRPGQTLKAGEYRFDRAISPREVIGKIRRGEIYYHALTIPEGFNIFDIAAAVGASGLAKQEEMTAAVREAQLIAEVTPSAATLEGYLFPDTYHFPRRTSAAKIAAAMVARFRKVYGELEQRHRPTRPAHEIVTLASLVEEETPLGGERPLVAGVFYNRLNSGMPLQCDPTVAYAAMLEGRYRGTIYQSDLAYDSPYNTYLRRGLPPGPIANPGRASLEAAMAPASTDHVFFVKKEGGGHIFSRTLQEHARGVAELRRSTGAKRSGLEANANKSNRADSGRRDRPRSGSGRSPRRRTRR